MKDREHSQLLQLIIIVLLFSPALASCMGSPTTRSKPNGTADSRQGLHVVGNQIETTGGTPLVYHGVNRSGSEYNCTAKRSSTFDGPSDQASISAMLDWHITIVRVPLNEDCWLGINHEPADGSTAAQYQQDIINYVNLLRDNNLAVILDLHWSAPGKQKALGQQPMPDADHAPAFWASVASTFKDDLYVLFDLYNEPYTMNWYCWLKGNTQTGTSPCQDVGFAVAGMQTLVNTVRHAGAANIIMLGGLAYANALDEWLQFKPHDPDNNLVASFHIYQSNGCNTTSCLASQILPILAKYPVLAGEIGEFDCGDDFINTIMPWFDSHHVGYLAWAWDTHDCSQFPSLISNYNGKATGYGKGFKSHLASLQP